MTEARGSPVTELTIERLFESPALSGPPLLGIKFSPDRRRVTYLRGRDADKDRLDLWEYEVATGRSRLLVDSGALAPADAELSEEEQSRRERQRTAALSGILEYAFAPSSESLLIPQAGRLFWVDLPAGADAAPARIHEISPADEPAGDASISPCGRRVAFVRGHDLFVHDLAANATRALTADGSDTIKNGLAEFVAQEEMDRAHGYWWSPDGSRLAFARVDEGAVTLAQRFAIAADNIAAFAQRYPAAGEANAAVSVGVVDVETGGITWMDLGADPDIYLARVGWLPDGRLAIQRQSRDQRRIDLLFADTADGRCTTVLTETSPTWVELHHELTFLRGAREFLWASSRDGHRHLYLYDLDGRLLRRLTAGEWSVDDFRARAIKAVDEQRRWVYFTATADHATRRRLCRASLDASDAHGVETLSREPGVHGVNFSSDAVLYADLHTACGCPPRLSLHTADGARSAVIVENRLGPAHPYAPFRSRDSLPELGTLQAADGQLLNYRLFKPAGFEPGRRYPAIVDVYGGPGVQRVLDQWTGGSFTQILTRAGYVVFQLDNRGSAHRGVRFREVLKGRLGEVEVVDQVRGARFLAAQSFIDPERLGVWGWSYGGYLTLMLMCRAPGLFRAGIAGAPVTDWAMYDTHYTERYLDRPADNPAGYAASAVLPYAGQLAGRLLVMHGMADDNVLFLHATKLFRRLQDLGKPFDVMVYPGAKHGLLRQHEGRHAYAAMIDFFGRHLAAQCPACRRDPR